MDYEKKYKEALENARQEYNTTENVERKQWLEELFPELKESEDEKIRKALIDGFTVMKESKNCGKTFSDHKIPVVDILAWLEKQREKKTVEWGEGDKRCIRDCIFYLKSAKKYLEKDDNILWNEKWFNSCIAWLEKQGEQKPVDKVIPKFRVGDWITNESRDVCLITDIDLENEYYICESNRFGNTDGDIDLTDKAFHLWTIEDAKDGDVLEFGDHGRLVTGIVSFVNKTTGKVDVSCLLEGDKFKVGVFYNLDTVKPHPATKAQRDTLFAKMRETGYEWDAEKKELRKIEQKSKWTEEDDYNVQCCIAKAEYDIENGCIGRNKELIEWLKSLKQRMI